MVSEERKKQMRDYRNNNKGAISIQRKNKYKLNPEPYKIKQHQYRKNNPDKVKLSQKISWMKNKEHHLEKNRIRNRLRYAKVDKEEYYKKKLAYEKERRKRDINYLIKKRLRLRVWQAIKGIRKNMYDEEFHLDYRSIITKLIATMPNDFNSKEYQIDHIKPLRLFNLKDEKQLLKAFAPENHQWLSVEEHKIKSAKELASKNGNHL